MAHLGLIRDAPQLCPFISLNDSCQGHELGVAVEPPIILAPGRCPHSWATNIDDKCDKNVHSVMRYRRKLNSDIGQIVIHYLHLNLG